MVNFESGSKWTGAIVEYLRRNPHAGDTAVGIARWWLGATPAEFAQVEDALRSLELQHIVTRWVAADGREHYRIGPVLLAAVVARR
jgi:hypothetical protein